jgi:hypothetical protein
MLQQVKIRLLRQQLLQEQVLEGTSTSQVASGLHCRGPGSRDAGRQSLRLSCAR